MSKKNLREIASLKARREKKIQELKRQGPEEETRTARGLIAPIVILIADAEGKPLIVNLKKIERIQIANMILMLHEGKIQVTKNEAIYNALTLNFEQPEKPEGGLQNETKNETSASSSGEKTEARAEASSGEKKARRGRPRKNAS